MSLFVQFISFCVLCLIALVLVSFMDPPEDPNE